MSIALTKPYVEIQINDTGVMRSQNFTNESQVISYKSFWMYTVYWELSVEENLQVTFTDIVCKKIFAGPLILHFPITT